MEIRRKTIRLNDLVEGYVDKGNEGVEGLSGTLDIRPPYQREFVYGDDRQQAVVDSVISGFPLGIMYWVDREDGTYEVLDGQERILSICNFQNRGFSLKHSGKPIYFDGMTFEEQEAFKL